MVHGAKLYQKSSKDIELNENKERLATIFHAGSYAIIKYVIKNIEPAPKLERYASTFWEKKFGWYEYITTVPCNR